MAHTFRDQAISICMLLALSAPASYGQIFSCVDQHGRKITSDRPISECRDRDQKELNPSGTIKRVVRPTMTAQEQQDVDKKLKAETNEKAQIEEDRRRNRALLSRYPDQPAHDKERASSLSQVDDVIKTAQLRIDELGSQRKKLNEELEFYKKDPAKAPGSLRRQIDENEKSVGSQRRFIGEQNEEKKRVNNRFDEELDRLRKLWAQAAAPTVAVNPAPMPPKK